MRHLAHEDLIVYQRAIEFVKWSHHFTAAHPIPALLRANLHKASHSIPLNIPEGHGKHTRADQAKFYTIARSAVLKCGACLDIFVAQASASELHVASGKGLLVEVVSMLTGLLKSSANLAREPTATYTTSETPEPGNGNQPLATSEGNQKPRKIWLSHETLTVYQRSVEFAGWMQPFVDSNSLGSTLENQLYRATLPIPFNIADGYGKYRGIDKASSYDNARGSASECSACLDVAVAEELVENDDIKAGKALLVETVSMLVALAKAKAGRYSGGKEDGA